MRSDLVDQHELEDLGKTYLSEKKLSKRTLKAYTFALKFYVSYLKAHDISYAKTSDVIKYRAYRKALGHSSHYIYIHLSFLKGFYRYLKTNAKKLKLSHHYEYDIMASIKNEKMTHHINKRLLTSFEANRMLMITKEKRKKFSEFRDYAIIYLMLTSGIRPYEIRCLKRDHYQDVNGQMLIYIEVKGHFDRRSFIKVSNGAKIALDDYLKLRDDDNPYLFISHRNRDKVVSLSEAFFQYMFKKINDTCGFKDVKITPHVLAHTAAIMNLKRGGSLASTKVLMRHQSIRSTLVYEDYLFNMTNHTSESIAEFILREEMSFDDLMDLGDIEAIFLGDMS
jgi:site-specific recombinase XerD